MKLLILTSSLPADDADEVPAFVKDQAIALKQAEPSLHIHLLAPHTHRTRKLMPAETGHYTETRYHYFWPHALEQVADGGIIPNLNRNPWLYLQVPFLFIGLLWATNRTIRKFRPDIIYAHWFTPQGIAGALFSKIHSIPFVFTSHSMDVIILRKIPFFGPKLARWGARRAHAITVVSGKTRDKLKQALGDHCWQGIRHKVSSIPMGVDTAHMKQLSSSGQDENNLLFVGRLVKKKGLPYLFKAVLPLLEEFPNLHIHVCGDGQELPGLQAMVNEMSLVNHVTFHGYVTGDDKDGIFKSCGTFVLPSIDTGNDTEGLPVSLMEAMASGKLIIASLESGAAELLDQESILHDPRDTREFTRHIRRTLVQDKDTAMKIIERNQSCIAQLDHAVVAGRMMELFNAAMLPSGHA